MITTVGLPFFAISAQAPLMQRWFARSTDKNAADPYFLYAASNLGSIVGLVSYPVIMEPFLPLTAQAATWTIGFIAMLAFVVCAGFAITRCMTSAPDTASDISDAVPVKMQLYWIVLAAVPSGLLLSVTTNMTTDIAAVPLMWAPPLLAYLLSFVVAFAPPSWLSYDVIRRLAPVFVIGLGVLGIFSGALGVAGSIISQVFFFFGVALACHATLVATRPAADRLTHFYLLMSLGGALGGAVVALLSPVLFNWVFEHPILIVFAALLLALPPQKESAGRMADIITGKHNALLWDGVFGLMAATLAGCVVAYGKEDDTLTKIAGYLLPVLCLVLLCYIARHRRIRFGLLIAICALTFSGWLQMSFSFAREFQQRSFFGVYRVGVSKTEGVRFISHGTTVHGAQSIVPAYRHVPQTYYVPQSGIGQIMSRTDAKSIGIIGLGSGALACYAKPGQSWSFYEIDPLVVDIAQNKSRFTYLSDCTPDAAMIVGDARLKLKEKTPGSYDMLVVDAFSSDSIPLHLITADAFDLYRSRLSKNGVLMIHVSNRYMDLLPVIGNVAQAQGWHAWSYKNQTAGQKEPYGMYGTPSIWIMMAQNDETAKRELAKIQSRNVRWTQVMPDPGSKLWTDNYANTLSVLKWLN
jgi:hypothetical protein